MQSGGVPPQGGGGHGRNTVLGPPSSSASPTSSSAVSQQQQQQQWQLLQQQLLRNPEGREAILAYQAGIQQGGIASGSGSMQMQMQMQKQRIAQQHSQEEVQNRRQGFDQNMMNPMQQAYTQQYAQQAQQAHQAQQSHQKSFPGIAQQQMKVGMMGIDQDLQSQSQRQFANLSSAGQLMQGNNIKQMQTPQNVNQMAQLMPAMQYQMPGQQKVSGISTGPQSNQQVNSPQFTNEGSPHSDVSGHSGCTKARQTMSPGRLGSTQNTILVNSSSGGQGQLFPMLGRENHLLPRQLTVNGSSIPSMPPPQSPANMHQGSGSELFQIQHARQQMNMSSSQSNASSNDVGLENPVQSQKVQKPPSCFTKQQFHVLKAQILAFRRIKKGEKTLPFELLQAIVPPPLEVPLESNNLKREGYEEKTATAGTTANAQGTTSISETPYLLLSGKEEQRNPAIPAKQEHEVDHGTRITNVGEGPTDKGKAVVPAAVSQSGTSPETKDSGPSRKYHGPLFDFPFFTRKHDGFGSSMMVNSNNNLTLAYDVKDLLIEEGLEVINKKKTESLKKIKGLLAVNLERKRIQPDLVLRLQIEEKKLLLQDVQTRVRVAVDQQQQEIMLMPDRPYKKFVRLCERQRMELNRQVRAGQRAIRDKQLKAIFQWRKKLLESHWAIRDARTSRNKGVAKYHEKMLREFSKNKDDNQSKRMEALKNNDVDRYREILMEQQHSVPGEAAERYEVLSSFLSQTEDYLNKLGGKITAAKNQQEVEEAVNAASTAARAQGLPEEEVRAVASCAREEVLIRNRFSEMNAPRDSSSVSKYYTLAHAVSERVIRQPSMLRKGTLRDYQLVGLQWMLSLYNNKLNGILADEMGLGKTVQVMALIAYLMEFKSNYGPHLIIVPNAVLVNWKSELHTWLPNVSCIYYVGNKDQRSKLFTQEVCSMKFNVLVTTYEFIMFDKSKLSRVDWKYIVIDEAQRMKDRESVLARDLDKYRCQRRLLLTGTPLQNDLKELWSLLNLLLPDVFDNGKVFHDWFSQPFQKEGSHNGEDDWLETEKKVIIIHRLHQILEPFMLRRRVEDVEGSLPPKISIILRCKMSAIQSVVYDWIKATGTIRVDPEDEKRKVLKSSMYQARGFKPLNNKCMELRKTCNHPLLNYPFFNDLSKDFLVKSCGKLWVLDRVLIKLQRTGHRVLLFSTMTKLLDILEEYLQWRRLVYRRIDGTTSLDDRESAIVDFNSPDTDCFIFLLSIRAAGRGLNLQTADTVIIYDPDPNPKNEEQAVARAHRIGQTREVKVIYMEAVVDKVSSHQKEDNFRNGENLDSDDDLAGTDRYNGSIESLIRNNIQQYKIEMADEVINAGRFDQRTTHEERRSTLESLLRDEERYQETVHDVPSLQEVNRMIARSEEEVELFDQMDEEFDWADEMTRFDQVPKWLRASTREVNTAIAQMSKKHQKNVLFTDNIGVESSEISSGITEKRRGRFKAKKFPDYAELDDDVEESYVATPEEAVKSDEETGDSDDNDKVQSQDIPASGNNGTGSSLDTRRLMPISVPAISSQKFSSRPSPRSRRPGDDPEEGEISVYGDSHVDHQQSGSLNHDHDENENEHVLQPKIKRKRSIRPRPAVDRSSLLHGQFPHFPFQAERSLYARTQVGRKPVQDNNTYKHEESNLSFKAKRTPPARKVVGQPTRANPISGPSEHSNEHSKERTDVKVKKGSGTSGGTMMTEAIQRRCKNVITKIQRRIDKEGHHIIPLLTDLWKRPEGSLLDLRKIELRVDQLEYNGVMDLIADVQVMLKGGMQYFGFSHEVRSEARKVHDLFFDIMKIAFPDTDFREARSALTFSGSVSASSPRGLLSAGQTKRPKPIIDHPDPEPSLSPRPPTRGSIPARETRFGNSSTQAPEKSRPFSHPGELVVCKKKRKEREKPGVVRAGNGNGPASPLSPIGRGNRNPGQSQSQAIGQMGNGNGASFGWANPVKRMRTDAAKRRSSQL